MNRTPPLDVRKYLRKEVGFGCPVYECGNPYLEWHHFDPKWSSRNHHNPKGMIALCAEHHKKADNGAYTKKQLKKFKKNKKRNHITKGKFDWLRNKILAVVGGNFYLDTPVILEFKNSPIIWFNIDSNGYHLLNVRMLSTSNEPRAIIQDNFWLSHGSEEDIESPPSGKKLKISYPNGDYVSIEYFELKSLENLKKKYPSSDPESWGLEFPITAVEINTTVANSDIDFGPNETKIGGGKLKGCFFDNCKKAIAIS